MARCYHCQQTIKAVERIGRRDTCPGCGVDLRCCLNCAFYDPGMAQACREPQAEPVFDKDRGNFCEFFALNERQHDSSSIAAPVRANVFSQLDALFKKKT